MTLKEFAQHINEYVRIGHGDEPVLLTLSQSSIGARACTGIQGIYPGFDWEDGQMRIEPSEKVCLLGRAKDDKRTIRIFAYSGTRKFYKCPACQEHVKKDSNYCQRCGQHLVFDAAAEPYDSFMKSRGVVNMEDKEPLSSNTVPDEYNEIIKKAVAGVSSKLRALGYSWDSICNFAYKSANDGLYSAEQDEIYKVFE